jgi:anti-anti-sigma factor
MKTTTGLIRNLPDPSGVTLVMGTGLLKCAASIGLMQVLEREAIAVNEIIASSAGAIFAASLILGHQADEIQSFMSRVVSFYRTAKIGPRRRLQILLPRLFGFNEQYGLVDNRPFVKLFHEQFGDKTFEDLRLPLSIIATNFANGKRILISQGFLWEALCATCSPLGLLPPLPVNGQMLIDGAASEPLPLAIATERRAKVIITLGFENPAIHRIQSLPNYTHQFRNILVNQLLDAQTALCNLAYDSEIIPLILQFGALIGQTDSEKFHFIVQKGAEAAKNLVPYLKTQCRRDAAAPADIECTEENNVLVIRPVVPLDRCTSLGDQSILDCITQDHCHIVVDMEAQTFLSSAGLRILLAMTREARRFGGDLRLARVHPMVQNVISMGFVNVIKLYGTLPGAIDSFGPEMAGIRWTDSFLDKMRQLGDPVADAAVAELFEVGQIQAVNQLMKDLVNNDYVPSADLPACIRTYLENTSGMPPWADWTRIQRGQQLFARYGLQIIAIFNCGSLPMSYAARKGVHVLWTTQRLNRQPYRRIIETAQMILDVMTPGSLQPGGKGLRSVQKVRLIHAAVRHLLLASGQWDMAAYDYPINQEDLAGTLMTFSEAIARGLPKLGISLTEENIEDYHHTWSVIGYMMGISPEMLPQSAMEAQFLADTIFRRQIGGTPDDNAEGRELTQNLLRMMEEMGPTRPFSKVLQALMRHLIGDEVADLLGLEATSWRKALTPFSRANRLLDQTTDHAPLINRVTGVVFREILRNLTLYNLGGDRTPFHIPSTLQQEWKLMEPSSPIE